MSATIEEILIEGGLSTIGVDEPVSEERIEDYKVRLHTALTRACPTADISLDLDPAHDAEFRVRAFAAVEPGEDPEIDDHQILDCIREVCLQVWSQWLEDADPSEDTDHTAD